MPGWPMWYWKTRGKDEAKVRQAAGYYDVVNFASRVKCPVLIGVGLIDTTCPSPGVFAAYNQIQGAKEIVVLPFGEHGEKKGSHGPLSCPIQRLEPGPGPRQTCTDEITADVYSLARAKQLPARPCAGRESILRVRQEIVGKTADEPP